MRQRRVLTGAVLVLAGWLVAVGSASAQPFPEISASLCVDEVAFRFDLDVNLVAIEDTGDIEVFFSSGTGDEANVDFHLSGENTVDVTSGPEVLSSSGGRWVLGGFSGTVTAQRTAQGDPLSTYDVTFDGFIVHGANPFAPGDTMNQISVNTQVSSQQFNNGNLLNTPITACPPEPELSVDKSVELTADADGSSDVTLGDTLTYTVTATNTGNVTLHNVVVSDSLVTNLTGTTPCSSVAPAGTCTLAATYVVTLADADAGVIVNTGTGDSDETEPVDDVLETAVQADPEITITKGPDDLSVARGGDFEWTIRVENTGNVTLVFVVVTDVLVPGCDRDSGDIAGLGSLAPGVVVEWTCSVFNVQAPILNVVEVDATLSRGGSALLVEDDDTSQLNVRELSVIKRLTSNGDEDSSSSVTLGDTLTYTVTATNTGNVTLTNVVVSDPLLTPNENTCASLASGGDCVLVGTFVVSQGNVDFGTIFNTGTADSDETSSVESLEIVDVSQSPGITIDKGPDGQAVAGGEEVTWTITVTNTGTVTLTEVEVTDALVPACDRDSGDIAGLASMAPGAVVQYTCTLADVQGSITNVAVATGTFFRPTAPPLPVVDSDDSAIEEVLPVTGLDTDRIAWLGLIALAAGGMLVLGAGLRPREN